MSKAFLLGVGCQKGGTTWIYEYLSGHPQADPGPKKGHHIFDALFIPDMQAAYQRRIAKLLAFLAGQGPPPDAATLRSAAYLFDVQSYFDHFHYRLLRDAGIRLTADITPDYAGLPTEALAMIRDGFRSRGVPIKVLFVLRDPVERCWSHVRMLRRQAVEAGESLVHPSAEAQLIEQHATELVELRTRYDLTLERLAAVFPHEDVHVVLYEELFTEASMQALCAFLGIDWLSTDLSRRVFASPDQAPDLSADTIRRVALHYAPVYEAAAKQFGPERVARCWASWASFRPGVATAG